MIIELIRKEFIRRRLNDSSSKTVRFIKNLLKLIFVGCFIALEVVTFMSLDKKITEYSTYGTYDFLVLYLFVVLLIGIVASLVQARKVLFSKDDNRVVMPLPISQETIVIAKGIYLYLNAAITSMVLSTPILLVFGLGRIKYAYYFIFTFLYPFLISLVTIGVTYALVAFVELFYKMIKVSDLLQFVLASALVIALCFAYKFVLDLFLTALSDSSVGGLFSKDFVEGLHHAAMYLMPVSNILEATILDNGNKMANVFIFFGIAILVMVVGFYATTYFYNLFNNRNFDMSIKNGKEKELKIVSPTQALLKKEFVMLFKNDAYTFSYTSLLILAPFLSFAVISSLNAIIYANLEFFSIYFPELVNGLNLTLVLLFLTVINSSAALSMSREGKMIQIVKYLPISPLKQIMIKLVTPMCLSVVSLLITLTTLIATGSIEPVVFGIALFLGVIILFADNVLSIEWDMHDKGISKYKMSGLNVLLSIGFPVLILFVHFLMSFTYVPGWGIYLTEAILGALLLLPCFMNMKKRYVKAFKGMEVA